MLTVLVLITVYLKRSLVNLIPRAFFKGGRGGALATILCHFIGLLPHMYSLFIQNRVTVCVDKNYE